MPLFDMWGSIFRHSPVIECRLGLLDTVIRSDTEDLTSAPRRHCLVELPRKKTRTIVKIGPFVPGSTAQSLSINLSLDAPRVILPLSSRILHSICSCLIVDSAIEAITRERRSDGTAPSAALAIAVHRTPWLTEYGSGQTSDKPARRARGNIKRMRCLCVFTSNKRRSARFTRDVRNVLNKLWKEIAELFPDMEGMNFRLEIKDRRPSFNPDNTSHSRKRLAADVNTNSPRLSAPAPATAPARST
ncbi:hypothetical protein EVAR_88595_1 [Eumeta japonica]|uniref:Uncharacterized protein n=1 Tax=Eumeta variegata TaxID=151549 RepID=A0A4C1YA71_EUMVA|nr:hypothetical protein EVAR_88595_1 [Eumeta japonica]